MKKYFFMAAATMAALISCSDDNDMTAHDDAKGETTFFATIESDAASRVSLNGNTPSWEPGDVISVDGHAYTADVDVIATGKFTGEGATEASHHAYYPADIFDNGTITLPATYSYEAHKFNMPMYAESTTNTLPFRNLCSVLAITVPASQMKTVTSIEVSSDQQMNGEIASISADGVFTFAPKTLTDADKKVAITFASPVNISTGSFKTFYVPVPAGVHKPLDIIVYNGTTQKIMRTKKRTGITIERNKIYPILFENNLDLLLPGDFSVSSRKKVKFTRSNIYWNGSTFHFEINPIDYPTSNSSGHIGHFYWTHSTDYTSGNPAYMPYATSFSCSASSSNDIFWCDKEHKLSVDGINGLYVLSSSEWDYLIKRAGKTKSGVAVTDGIKNVHNCFIIAPDNYTGTLKSEYTLDEIDADGLVCLPPAGMRLGTNVLLDGSYGFYWSSTLYERNVDEACRMIFNLNYGGVDHDIRSDGFSIRLAY